MTGWHIGCETVNRTTLINICFFIIISVNNNGLHAALLSYLPDTIGTVCTTRRSRVCTSLIICHTINNTLTQGGRVNWGTIGSDNATCNLQN